jgi:hypothetical protein
MYLQQAIENTQLSEAQDLWRTRSSVVIVRKLAHWVLQMRSCYMCNASLPSAIRKRGFTLSITHNFSGNAHSEDDIGEPRESAPDHHIAWWRVVLARQVPTELCQLREVLR